MKNNIVPFLTNDEVSSYRRREMSEEMVLSCIAFGDKENSDNRLLSGRSLDSIIDRLSELRLNKFMDHKNFINRGD